MSARAAMSRSSSSAVSRRAVLAVAAPGLVLLSPPGEGWLYTLVPSIGCGLLLAVAIVRLEMHLVGRLTATVALLGSLGWSILHLLGAPGASLALTLAAGTVVARLWPSAGVLALEARSEARPGLGGLQAASITAVIVLAVGWLLGSGTGPSDELRVVARVGVAWMPAWFASPRRRALVWPRVLGLVVPPLLLALALLGLPRAANPWVLVITPVLLWLVAWRESTRVGREPRGPGDILLASPGAALVGTFGLLCVIGTALLTIPGAKRGAPIELLDAAFTAVSATCVTGLIVLDTPTDFTFFGQLLILGMIQVGGLGIMTFSAAIFALLGRRMSVLHEATAAELVGAEARSDVWDTVRRVLVVTVVTEGAGALLLFPLFLLEGDGPFAAAWRALFTSISAFCNAGFALQTASLVPYQHNLAILLVLAALIVVGGLGPAVVASLPAWTRGEAVSLHVRLVIVTSAVLIVVPALLFAVVEWEGTLGGMPVPARLVNALFQAVTLRTAGFNSIDLAEVQPAIWTVMIVCMFVGGSPGSTAGGIKTTTVAILLLAVAAAIRGRHEVRAGGRRIPHRTVYEAASITSVGLVCGVAGLLALQLTHSMPLDVAFFEVVSALATVGLSIGGTSELDAVGKLVVLVGMFAGRVGPVTLFALLAGVDERSRVRYPEARVPVG